MKRLAGIFYLSVAASIGVLLPMSPAMAIRLSDGKSYFVHLPSLVDASTTFNHAYAWGATYYFTLVLPENAGEPLGMVMISQKDFPDNIEFNLANTVVFAGIPSSDRTKLGVKAVTWDDRQKTALITFDPPVAPGQVITIGLSPDHNPRYGGVYLFGVTAFPIGENPQGHFLGYGRLHFYNYSDF
jgi:hypothetical protein